jgi:murein DD-endopeptidase MepM/ murein hydrolase activator NlpD
VKKRNYYFMAGAAAMLFLLFACSGITTTLTKVTDAITNPTARQLYVRELKDNKPALDSWEAAYSRAWMDSLAISLPYGERGTFLPNRTVAYSYIFNLQEGEVLVADVVKDSVKQRVFMDVFALRDSVYQKEMSNAVGETRLEFDPKLSGTYKLIIQPEIAANTHFFISLSKKPGYAFPVAGKGNAAIGSFWGMDRDGGKRRHEGIDIFAKKGTPVLAVTNGTVSRTGTTDEGLGGKQVWLRAGGLFGNSLYYAHLDSVAVLPGATVKTGDTLGFVGNTGNARFTPAHLHFGVYRGGAVNPLPYVYETEKVIQSKFPVNYKTELLKLKNTANLRQGPATSFKGVGNLAANDTVVFLGQTNDWLHIQTPAGIQAFVHKKLVKEIN